MLSPYDTLSVAPLSSAPSARPPSAGRSGPPDPAFARLLSEAGAADAAPATAAPPPAGPAEAAEIARLREERAAYQEKRDAEVRSRPQEPYPAIQIALPVNAAGYQPFVTADQQKLIDSITDRYIGKSEAEFLKMWDELNANGVGPEQLARTAAYFINAEGDIVGRDVATRDTAMAAGGSAVWRASEL